jgi:hypothetical protein
MKKFIALLLIVCSLAASAQTSVSISNVRTVKAPHSPYYQDIVTVQACATGADQVYGGGVKGKIVEEPQIGLAANINDPSLAGQCKTYELVIWLTKKQTTETRIYTGFLWTDQDGYFESQPYTVTGK